MPHLKTVLFAVFANATLAQGAAAAEYGNAPAGLEVSRQWCVECHVVEEGQAAATQMQAPAFSTVAETIDDDRRDELTAWLTTPHGPMQVISLSRQQIADVLAYIASLKKP